MIAILQTGCINPFAPKLINSLETDDLIITSQRSPQEVLQNFKVAYTFRDSLLYSNLLDTAFLFIYYDFYEGTSGQYVSWGRDIDLKTTGRLFRHYQVIDLVWNETLYESQTEESGDLGKSFNLTLIGQNSDYKLSGKAIFSFRKCQDEKWRITRWKDESDV
jgi:hypothetical protein